MKMISLVLATLAATALFTTSFCGVAFGQEQEAAMSDPYLAEAERISGQRLRSPELSNPGSSSSVDEGALRLAEQIAGQPLRSG